MKLGLQLIRYRELRRAIQEAINLALCFLTHESCGLPCARVVEQAFPLDVVFCAFLTISCTYDPFNLLVIVEGVEIGFTVEVPSLSVFGRHIWILRQAELCLDDFAKVVLETAEAAIRRQFCPRMPSRMVMRLPLPFNLIVRVSIRIRCACKTGGTYIKLVVMLVRRGRV